MGGKVEMVLPLGRVLGIEKARVGLALFRRKYQVCHRLDDQNQYRPFVNVHSRDSGGESCRRPPARECPHSPGSKLQDPFRFRMRSRVR